MSGGWGGGGGPLVGARLELAANTAINGNLTPPWAAVFDQGGPFVLGGAPHAFTIPKAGKYRVHAKVNVSIAANDYSEAWLYVNAVVVDQDTCYSGAVVDAVGAELELESGARAFAAGDVVSVTVHTTAAQTLSGGAWCFASIEYLGS